MKPLLITTLTFGMLSQAIGQTQPSVEQRRAEIKSLREELSKLAARLDALEREDAAATVPPSVSPTPEPAAPVASTAPPQPAPVPSPEQANVLGFFQDTTINFGLDGYYGYNFNHPIGRVNSLRVYDVTSNSFSINQASIVVERLPQAKAGSRFGGRIDLQFGQATETLQGSGNNEQRPQVWRNLFQAYGSYLAPIGSGLQLDFGKFASALGMEGNYTKDQIAYSRSYTFNFLPYYHMGLRTNYNVTPKFNVSYWLVNGAQQTEDFNGFKSQAFLLNYRPNPSFSWNLNYYFGQEQRDVLPTLNAGGTVSPTQPGLPTTNISPAPDGKNHIFDSYALWNVTSKLTLAGEADYVVYRVQSHSLPQRAAIGAAYIHYTLPKASGLAARFEYFDDRGELFSGKRQALKEITLVADHQVAAGFLARAEYRRDFSNHPYFLTDESGRLNKAQTTATLGLVYWWGTKQGSW